VYEKKIGDDEMTFVTGCKNPKAVSILLRGGTEHVVDELERSLEDATSVVAVAIEDGKVISGGGSSAMESALALRDFASTVGGGGAPGGGKGGEGGDGGDGEEF